MQIVLCLTGKLSVSDKIFVCMCVCVVYRDLFAKVGSETAAMATEAGTGIQVCWRRRRMVR